MGASDTWGLNRNYDGWTRETLKKDHGNFVKYAKWYRSHKNKDPKKSYGHVKLSHYNDPMDRVELLVFLNNNEKAASKYGGLPATEELNLIHANKDIPVSMATRIAFDECLACGNKAKTRNDYCKSAAEGGSCVKFGCKNGLGAVDEDGFVQGVDNPSENYFFDISKVWNPAERTAYGFSIDYLDKKAEDNVIGGAALAEQYDLVTPLQVRIAPITDAKVAELIKLAYTLAAIEDRFEKEGFDPAHVESARAFTSDVQPELDLEPLTKHGGLNLSAALSEMSKHKIAMPFRDFVRLLYKGAESKIDSWLVKKAADCLPGVYNRLISSPYLEDMLKSDNPFVVTQELAPLNLRKWAEAIAPIYSLDANHVEKRAILSAVRQLKRPTLRKSSMIKSASIANCLDFNKEAETLARYYGIYKLSTLYNKDFKDMELTAERAILQNYVS